MKRLFAAVCGLAMSTGTASAGQCEDDIAKIEKALASMELSGDERAQLEDMKEQARQLCAEGHETEGLDVTGEAKAMLRID
ncbi:MAG: hypothetical protein JNM20_05830 [Rhizobiales bacterium]|nr:hypothetical protein [Hyphomicrobiales bacterium]